MKSGRKPSSQTVSLYRSSNSSRKSYLQNKGTLALKRLKTNNGAEKTLHSEFSQQTATQKKKKKPTETNQRKRARKKTKIEAKPLLWKEQTAEVGFKAKKKKKKKTKKKPKKKPKKKNKPKGTEKAQKPTLYDVHFFSSISQQTS